MLIRRRDAGLFALAIRANKTSTERVNAGGPGLVHVLANAADKMATYRSRRSITGSDCHRQAPNIFNRSIS